MILVSKCLLGGNCKYNGGNNLNEKIVQYLKDKEYAEICPECMGGLTVPRDPSEICRVTGKVLSSKGKDVTESFINGAKKSLEIAIQKGAHTAILKQSSPSCGFGTVYDGSFTNTKIGGNGITAQLLSDNGLKILTEKDF